MWNCSYLKILAGAMRLFPRLKTPYFQNKAKGKDFCGNDFNLHENKLKSFAYKCFALSLALKQMVGETLKWPILVFRVLHHFQLFFTKTKVQLMCYAYGACNI